jgi:hypothetical protein
MQALLEARAAPQSTTLVEELAPDIRAWREGVAEILGSLADEPRSVDHETARARLGSTITQLEARIQGALDAVDEGGLTRDESQNMYRLLSAHRGVSESLVRLTQQADSVDWERLREARFS